MKSRHVIILGCERSGSTWLTNILDAHPQIDVYMEPFADYVDLFPGFPSRNLYIKTGSKELAELIESGYSRLADRKYPLLYKPGKPLYLQTIDRYLVRLSRRIYGSLYAQPVRRIRQYNRLNLNRSTIPISRQTRKVQSPSIEVTKELRLNFKVRLLSQVFPEAHYIVAIRHPGAQIQSILRLFRNKRLGELSTALCCFYEYVTGETRFEKYWPSVDELQCQDDEIGKLAIWWLINYETLLEDLEANGLHYHLVPHEQTSERPKEVAKSLFHVINLTFHHEVDRFIDWSSTTDQASASPINTARKSSTYYRSAISNVEPAINEKIKEIASSIRQHKGLEPHIHRYLTDLGYF